MIKRLFILAFLIPLVACGNDVGQGAPDSDAEEAINTMKENQQVLTVEELEERIVPGMDLDTYAVEIQSWVEKNKAVIEEKVKTETTEVASADIIQVSDGYLAVENDGLKVTDVTSFSTVEEAKDYVQS